MKLHCTLYSHQASLIERLRLLNTYSYVNSRAYHTKKNTTFITMTIRSQLVETLYGRFFYAAVLLQLPRW